MHVKFNFLSCVMFLYVCTDAYAISVVGGCCWLDIGWSSEPGWKVHLYTKNFLFPYYFHKVSWKWVLCQCMAEYLITELRNFPLGWNVKVRHWSRHWIKCWKQFRSVAFLLHCHIVCPSLVISSASSWLEELCLITMAKLSSDGLNLLCLLIQYLSSSP